MDNPSEIDLERPETWPASAREYLARFRPALPESPLLELLRAEIQAGGPISFARFMELALYHSKHGYYVTTADRIGPGGDFVTAPTAHPAFGQLLSRRIADLWQRLGRPEPFVVAEAGAGTGALAEQILAFAAEEPPLTAGSSTRGTGSQRDLESHAASSAFTALHYRIIEPFPGWRAVQEARLAERKGRVAWFAALEEQPDAPHLLLANELLDALPVHRVVGHEAGLRELYVTIGPNGEFVDQEAPPSTPELERYFTRMGLEPPPGITVEVSLAAVAWLQRALATTRGGWIWLLDYGGEAGELYTPPRAGTLRAYHDHALSINLFSRIGGQDLTADVDFTTLIRTAEAEGWWVEEFTTQRDLLLSLGLEEWLQPTAAGSRALAPGPAAGRWALLQLVDPHGMGAIRSLLLRDARDR